MSQRIEYVDGPLKGRLDSLPGEGPPPEILDYTNVGTWMPNEGYAFVEFKEGTWRYGFRG